MKKIIYILFVILVFNGPAFAGDWDDDTKTQMRDAFVQSTKFVKENAVAKSMAEMPAGILKYFANLYNISEEQLSIRLHSILELGFSVIKTLEISFDAESFVYRQAPNGDLFALIPYSTHMVMVDGESDDEDSVIFAFKTDGRWYFVDLENPLNVDAVKAVYPQFKDVDFNMPESHQ